MTLVRGLTSSRAMKHAVSLLRSGRMQKASRKVTGLAGYWSSTAATSVTSVKYAFLPMHLALNPNSIF